MSALQAALIGVVAALSVLEGGWLGECKLREPVVTGFLVGLILGNVKELSLIHISCLVTKAEKALFSSE